ncbi:MAG: 3'-5' exonuclease [Gammaproteobacteria bacterium]|jgi:DNA polymerase-3 subunit epsilon|nr:3'-5' exonuclease [Gammaproteobacteria bacterium]MBT3724951.1 3'-5' exonuclease [Gammaproteobacteria bacterium]MBT4078593.1 3'-5' exonuclease [Gammaproteobacteria bacterium]MBT4194340.1 3'-5' exonuclease [Gammaproteobacteria bacterium]MBT4448600.1 3'-5' exonuclease [Gammaproteobacteria bacterium]
MPNANTIIILDFETTGLSPNQGDRAIEIGAVLIENGVIKDRFQQLMNPGFRVDGFIESYTGITNSMLKDAAPCEEVMNDFADFIEDYHLVAHNASFDKCFLDAELKQISRSYSGQFVCSMLAARRVYQTAPNYKLATLIDYLDISVEGDYHRALYDSEMTTKLWLSMLESLCVEYNIAEIPFELIKKLTKTPKKSVDSFMQRWKSTSY